MQIELCVFDQEQINEWKLDKMTANCRENVFQGFLIT